MALKYIEIARDLSNKIVEKYFLKQLPSEAELIDMYMVSRNTVRNALSILANQGLIRRVQGSGYYINERLLNRDDLLLMDMKVGNKKTPHELTTKVLSFNLRPVNEQDIDLLDCEPNDSVYDIVRLRHQGDELFSLEHSYYLKSVIPYLDEKICEESLFTFIVNNYDINVNSSDDFITLYTLNDRESELTGKPVGSHCVSVEEINHSNNNTPFNYSKILYFQELTYYYHVSNALK